jgi:hypothetical protein
MAQFVSFYDRGGDKLLHSRLIEVVPRRSESVSMTTDDGQYIQAFVINVCHSLPQKPDSTVRIGVLLDWPK